MLCMFMCQEGQCERQKTSDREKGGLERETKERTTVTADGAVG